MGARVLGLSLALLCFVAPALAVEFYTDKQCKPQILELIRNTRDEIVVSVFDISEPEIVDALIEAHFEGKKIRILSDRRQAKNKHSALLDLDLLGLDVRLNSRRRLHHNKFVVSDDKTAANGSFNWTKNASRSNSEDLTVMRWGLLNWSENRSIAEMKAKFEADWEANTQEKSDGYFETILNENRGSTRDRMRGWVTKTLREADPRTKAGKRKLVAAMNVVEKLEMFDQATLNPVAEWAHPSDRYPGVRAAAVRALGKSRTRDVDHQILLLTASADSHSGIKAAGKEAVREIGTLEPEAQRYQGLGAAVWNLRVYCNSLWRRLGL